jgi:UDP-N-acetylmuramoyl-L-alanyl-D-glutamate--2,6-diaminopimelate ligase
MVSVGITGTNGKTSTTHLLAAALSAAGRGCVALSTVRAAIDDVEFPQPSSLQGMFDLLQRGVEGGHTHAVIELTSRALQHGYAKRWRFDLGVFTNLSPDHLTTHGTWEQYLAAKAQLFVHLGPGRVAVLNAGDPHTHMLDVAIPADVQRRWFWAPGREPAPGPAPDLAAAAVRTTPEGTTIDLVDSPWADALGGHLGVRMVGSVFAENALAAAAAGLALELPPAAIVAGLARCPVVPGRFEVVGHDPLCVVDYAHTPDALARTCETARQLTPEGRVIVVFGAGGGASPDKREPMGEAVGRAADLAIVTADNPRDEDPQVIAAALARGVRRGGRAQLRLVADRRAAIGAAIDDARGGDIVVVAGRGHEREQRRGTSVEVFSDAEVIAAHRGAP